MQGLFAQQTIKGDTKVTTSKVFPTSGGVVIIGTARFRLDHVFGIFIPSVYGPTSIDVRIRRREPAHPERHSVITRISRLDCLGQPP